jgi:4'-phosphopantetheinyl transferase
LKLSNNEVVVRWMRTPQAGAAETHRLLEMLDDGEHAQAQRFKVETDRAAYIAAHALLRATLSAVTERTPMSWRFTTDLMGRPQIEPAHELRFSLSHCRRFVACAVCRGFDIGIDVEDMSRPEAQWHDALTFLRDEERAQIEAAHSDERRDRFFKLWTIREAFAKASGLGMARALEMSAIEESPDWYFESCRPIDDLAIALASSRPMNPGSIVETSAASITQS